MDTRLKSACLCAAVLMLAACRSTVVVPESKTVLPQAFSHVQAARGSAEIGRWWQHWNDPVLSGLIEQGLQESHDIQIARSRLEEARAQARLAGADKGVQAGFSGEASRVEGRISNPLSEEARTALGRIPQAATLGAERFDLSGSSITGGLSASWEPDIFGKKSSDTDAARHAATGAQEQVYGTQLLVSGEIAEHYFKARAAQARLRSADRSITTLERLAEYVRGRFRAGHLTAYEVAEAEAKLTALRAKRSTIESEYAAHVRSIAVLAGRTPQTFALLESRIDVLAAQPAAPGGQTPQGLLERRPDIRARAAQVNAYAAKLAGAKADLLPRFSIEFLSRGTISIDTDSGLKGWGGLLKAGIHVPVFTNGRIKANIAAADARFQTALLQYDQNIVKALGEVDSAYQAHHALTRQNALLSTAHKQAEKQANDAGKLFKYGHKTLDNVLTARLNEEAMRENLIQSQLARAQMLVGLYKALGGGWEPEGR